jgi:4'-phosphopantetheinyl transferase
MKRDGIAEPRSLDDAPSPPAPGELHVWRVELPAEERRAVARAALADILAAYLGGPAAAALAADAGGKPRLAEAPGRLSFNLSHSGGLALVAVAPGGVEVGVDVERLRPRRDLVRLAARWLPGADAAAVADAASDDERERRFYAAWTRHEARVKCTGAGLGGPPPGDEIVARQLEVGAGYAAAVAFDRGAAGGREPRIELRDR